MQPVVESVTGSAHCRPGVKVGEATITWHTRSAEAVWLLPVDGSAASAPAPKGRPGALGPLPANGSSTVAIDCTKSSGNVVVAAYQLTRHAQKVVRIATS